MSKFSSVVFGALIISGLSACNGSGDQAALMNPSANSGGGGSSKVTPTPAPSGTSTPAPTDVSGLYTGSADFATYVSKFVSDGAIQNVDVVPGMGNPKLEIQLGDLSAYGQYVIGLCESGGGMKRVTFSTTFWNSVDETQRELLAHHELGHCVLGRPHRNDLLPSGEVASIMYPVIMSNATYQGNYDYYQNELFTQAETSQATTTPDSDGVTRHICNIDELGGGSSSLSH